MSADPYEIDFAERIEHLATAATADADWYARMAETLVRPGDRVAVDVGCGGGGMVRALAAALGEDGLTVGADRSPELLEAARARVTGPGRIEWVVVDLDEGVEAVREAAGPADVVWASASVHHLGDQQAAITEPAALLAPGGRLALAEGGLPARRLPWDLGVGDPGLEVRLDAAQDRWFARMRAGLPGSVPMPYGWAKALRRARLDLTTSVTTVIERPAPLDEEDRRHVVDGFADRIGRLRETDLLDAADLAAWDRLLDPDDEAWLGHRADLQDVQARTVHIGHRADGTG